jgi:ATP-dependent RNA helicase DDX60
MSFVPAPQQAIAAGANNAPNQVTSNAAASAAEEVSDKDLLFKLRTFDVHWVDKTALMYRDGFDKVSGKVVENE